MGIPPLAANVTNSVALVGSGLSSASRAAPDITGQGPTIRRWMPVSITLSLAGAILLVVTPGGVFGRVVPFLVAVGSLTLLMQPRISRWQKENEHSWGRTAVFGGLGAVAVYNGYFGAGSGILLIALLLLTAEPVLHRANAVKNVILAASDLLPAGCSPSRRTSSGLQPFCLKLARSQAVLSGRPSPGVPAPVFCASSSPGRASRCNLAAR